MTPNLTLITKLKSQQSCGSVKSKFDHFEIEKPCSLMKKPAKSKTGIAHIGPTNVDASRDGEAAPMTRPID